MKMILIVLLWLSAWCAAIEWLLPSVPGIG